MVNLDKSCIVENVHLFNKWRLSYRNIWVISDLFLNSKISSLVDENWVDVDKQIEIINKKISDRDLLIVIGDPGDIKYIKEINCSKILITDSRKLCKKLYLNKKYSRYLSFDEEIEYIRAENKEYVLNELLALKPQYYNVKVDTINSRVDYDCGMFDEIYDGPLMIRPHIVLSHRPVKISRGLNVHGDSFYDGESKRVKDNLVWFNVTCNVLNFEPVNLEKIYYSLSIKALY